MLSTLLLISLYLCKKLKHMKGNKLRTISKDYGFKETEKHQGQSFLLDCSFWETRHKDVLITDYDFINSTDLKEKNASLLLFIKKGKSNCVIISNSIFDCKEKFNIFLDAFNEGCQSIFN